ncbi:small ribosomal subunit protein mS31-like [Diceros bicornis minor]|uniref:small ribosomal subunit protein mS31-like n=1 Tax=Diceros bicornis minor TaxID=77932 RepID=UPI0026EB210E|nr:small ribosomal subunit protein mS31-like [Diceros bicornis minor]
MKGMKVELSTVNVQTTKPPNRRQLKSLEATVGRLPRASEDAPKEGNQNWKYWRMYYECGVYIKDISWNFSQWSYVQRRGFGPTSKDRESLSPKLVAAASAVADSLAFDKQTTKSELLRQLQQHGEDARAQKDGERPKISFSNVISDMKVARSATARVSTRPVP